MQSGHSFLGKCKSPACGEGLGWSLPVVQFSFDFIDGILGTLTILPYILLFSAVEVFDTLDYKNDYGDDKCNAY